MAAPRQLVPRCSVCLRSYALGPMAPFSTPLNPSAQQQTRGKKRLPNNSATVTVRLLKDTPEFGRKGALVPVPRGQMRNQWFPLHTAEYVTAPELKRLRANGASIERDYGFMAKKQAIQADDKAGQSSFEELLATRPSASKKKETPIARVSATRSIELMDILVPKRLDYYRPVIIEEETSTPTTVLGGIGGDLFAASPLPSRQQAIYGSVSTQDVLTSIRALLANDEEAARIGLETEDIHFADLSTSGDVETDKVKHTGDFHVEIRFKGSQELTTRTVRVIAQESP